MLLFEDRALLLGVQVREYRFYRIRNQIPCCPAFRDTCPGRSDTCPNRAATCPNDRGTCHSRADMCQSRADTWQSRADTCHDHRDTCPGNNDTCRQNRGSIRNPTRLRRSGKAMAFAISPSSGTPGEGWGGGFISHIEAPSLTLPRRTERGDQRTRIEIGIAFADRSSASCVLDITGRFSLIRTR